MYPHSKSVTPAVRTHLDAQVSFLNDLSKSIFQSFQQLSDLNLQLAQTLLEESTIASQQLLTAEQHTDVINAAAARAQPSADKLRAYQQHLSRLTAESQVELSRVAEEHIQETSRTAKALADEVARTTEEETEHNVRKQEESIHQFSDPFTKTSRKGGGASSAARGGASLQSGHSGQSQGGGQGNSQGGNKQP